MGAVTTDGAMSPKKSNWKTPFKAFVITTVALFLSACAGEKTYTPSDGVTVSDQILMENGKVLTGDSFNIGIGSGSDRVSTLKHIVTVKVDPNTVKLRRVKPDSIIVADIATYFEIKYEVTGDLLVTRRLPRKATKTDTASVELSSANNWQSSVTLTYPDVLLGRSLNVMSLRGKMVGTDVNSTARVTRLETK